MPEIHNSAFSGVEMDQLPRICSPNPFLVFLCPAHHLTYEAANETSRKLASRGWDEGGKNPLLKSSWGESTPMLYRLRFAEEVEDDPGPVKDFELSNARACAWKLVFAVN